MLAPFMFVALPSFVLVVGGAFFQEESLSSSKLFADVAPTGTYALCCW